MLEANATMLSSVPCLIKVCLKKMGSIVFCPPKWFRCSVLSPRMVQVVVFCPLKWFRL